MQLLRHKISAQILFNMLLLPLEILPALPPLNLSQLPLGFLANVVFAGMWSFHTPLTHDYAIVSQNSYFQVLHAHNGYGKKRFCAWWLPNLKHTAMKLHCLWKNVRCTLCLLKYTKRSIVWSMVAKSIFMEKNRITMTKESNMKLNAIICEINDSFSSIAVGAAH